MQVHGYTNKQFMHIKHLFSTFHMKPFTEKHVSNTDIVFISQKKVCLSSSTPKEIGLVKTEFFFAQIHPY